MSEGINKVILLGNLGADAELKQTSVGPVLKFNLATTRVWKDKEDKKQEKTEWHRCTVFGKRGEALAKHLQKGTKLFVGGELHYSSYDKDGQKHYSTEIVADEIQFGGRANGAYTSKPANAATTVEMPF